MKGPTMSQEQLLQISTDGTDSVTLQLDATSPMTVRLLIDGGCGCKHGKENRPGSYIDTEAARNKN
jgi:hypothetical protein